jgi:hypothetical protein
VTSPGFLACTFPSEKAIHAIAPDGGNIVPDFRCSSAGYWWDPVTRSLSRLGTRHSGDLHNDAVRTRVLESGAVCFLLKPFDAQSLI